MLHGYTNSNAGYEDVRAAVAQSLNERLGQRFASKYYNDSGGGRRSECDF